MHWWQKKVMLRRRPPYYWGLRLTYGQMLSSVVVGGAIGFFVGWRWL